jgi:hypothetical protein
LIVRANARRDKAPVLLELREEMEELKVLLRLCHDAKAFANFNSFEHAVTHQPSVPQSFGGNPSASGLDARLKIAGMTIFRRSEIAKQNEGWLKSQQQGRGPTGAGQNRPAMPDRLAEASVP